MKKQFFAIVCLSLISGISTMQKAAPKSTCTEPASVAIGIVVKTSHKPFTCGALNASLRKIPAIVRFGIEEPVLAQAWKQFVTSKLHPTTTSEKTAKRMVAEANRRGLLHGFKLPAEIAILQISGLISSN